MAVRDLTPAMEAAIQAGNVYPALLYEGEFVDGAGAPVFVRLWSGIGTLSWDSKSWLGVGNFIGMSDIRESTGLRANAFEAWLSGQSTALVATALTAFRKNRSGKLYLAAFTAGNFTTPIDAPYLLKKGRSDTIPIDDSGEAARIAVRYEDRLATLGIARERRYTTGDQALRDPPDKGFEYVEALQDRTFILPTVIVPG